MKVTASMINAPWLPTKAMTEPAVASPTISQIRPKVEFKAVPTVYLSRSSNLGTMPRPAGTLKASRVELSKVPANNTAGVAFSAR